MGRAKIWFEVLGGKTHELFDDEDTKRFPHGRALCAPFARHKNDGVFNTNEVPGKQFCSLCVKAGEYK